MCATRLNHDSDDNDDVSEWLQCRKRFLRAAKAILPYGSIWRKNMPDVVADRVHAEYGEHIESAHSWLRSTLCLLEKADIDERGGVLPFEVNPTPETVAVLSFALDKNERYLHLVSKAVQMMLAYIQHERELLQEWSEEQATKFVETAEVQADSEGQGNER